MSRATNLLSEELSHQAQPTDRQIKLAAIAEMIHTASLVHDDVIDEAETRRGNPSSNVKYGDQPSILAGDFIIARASQLLASLGSTRVVEVMSGILTDLVHGEVMQLSNGDEAKSQLDYYVKKSFFKTASLMARSCQSAVILGRLQQGESKELEQLERMSFSFGEQLGIAFQVVDDLLDIIATTEALGKPAAADMRLGLATAPVLYAKEENSALQPLIARKFCREGDVEEALRLIATTSAVDRTRELISKHCDLARAAVLPLPESEDREALLEIVNVVQRRGNETN
eukprot:Clim_evm80s156 gene=Clim_evmTU80s156